MMQKRMSFFWSGTMTWLRYLTLASFRALHPDWEIRLYQPSAACGQATWNSLEMDDRDYQGHDYRMYLAPLELQQIPWTTPQPEMPAAHASDLFQWKILAQESGCYADMDVLFVRPLDELLDRHQDADAIFCFRNGWATIGFFASAGDNAMFRDVHQMALKNYQSSQYQCTGAGALYRMAQGMRPYGPMTNRPGDKVLEKFRIHYAGLKIADVPGETFYPVDWVGANSLWSEDRPLPASTLGIHWFAGNATSHNWNTMLLDERTWGRFQNTITSAIRNLLDRFGEQFATTKAASAKNGMPKRL